MSHNLTGLRGQAYYDGLLKFLGVHGQKIIEDARQIKNISILDVGRLALKYDLNFKATCEWLEESRIIPTGTHDKIKRQVNVKEIYEALQHNEL